jgi:hypothetical protein
MFYYQNAGQSCDIEIANETIKNVAEFIYLGLQ